MNKIARSSPRGKWPSKAGGEGGGGQQWGTSCLVLSVCLCVFRWFV